MRDVERLIETARAFSPFSYDGGVIHELADEIERMQHFMSRRFLVDGGFLTELDVYWGARRLLADGAGHVEDWPEHLR